jgi:lysophospholipase L1-like esterase
MGYFGFDAPPGRHVVRVQPLGGGVIRVFGIVAETTSPGVVVDTLGIGGATIAGQLRWNESIWSDAARHRTPDLVTLAYGTNELMDPDLSFATYERQLRQALDRIRRVLPETSCVLLSPFDVPVLKDGRWGVRQNLVGLIGVQRRVSREFGCGFWDGYAFMGGSGSMHRWVTAKPPLARPDHVHLTRLGYAYAGAAIADALMRAFDSGPRQSEVAAIEGSGSGIPDAPAR